MLYNWEIQERPLYQQVSTYIQQDINNVIPLDNYKVLRRSDNQEVLNVVKDSYVPVTNKDFEDIIGFLCDAGCQIEKHGEYKDGGITWCELSNVLLPDMSIYGEDETQNHITLVNSHNGMYSLQMLLTNIRLICMNKFSMMLKKGRNMFDKIRHTKNAPERIEALKFGISDIGDAMKEMNDRFNIMANTEVNDLEAPKLFKKILNLKEKPRKRYDEWTEPQLSTRGANQMQVLADKYYTSGAEGTAWGVFNAITDYAKKYESDLFGAGMTVRKRAYEVLSNHVS